MVDPSSGGSSKGAPTWTGGSAALCGSLNPSTGVPYQGLASWNMGSLFQGIGDNLGWQVSTCKSTALEGLCLSLKAMTCKGLQKASVSLIQPPSLSRLTGATNVWGWVPPKTDNLRTRGLVLSLNGPVTKFTKGWVFSMQVVQSMI